MTRTTAERPDSPRLADRAASWRAAYLHIPFCARRCPYCDFAVVTPNEQVGPVERYMKALVDEIDMEPSWRPLDAVYIGGGTPTQVDPGFVGATVRRLADRFGIAKEAEISIEANPEDWSGRLAAGLLEAGVTRVSFGVQSFEPATLAALGRRHTPEQAALALTHARSAGFDSVSVDLIFGTPGESVESWVSTVERVLALEPDHVSTYGLTVERGTELSRVVAAGARAPDDDDMADKYLAALERLGTAGYIRYEVSNHARAGHAVRYNLTTWAQGEYLAFGLGAHGHRDGVRRRNVRRLDAYLEAVEAGRRPEAGADAASGWALEQERLFLGIRRTAGVIIGEGGAKLLESDRGRRLVAGGVLTVAGGRLQVLQPLLTDEVSRAVLSLSDDDC